MISYTLPGYYTDKEAQNIKTKLQGKTYLNFMVEYGGIAGNNEVIIMSNNTRHSNADLRDMAIAYVFSSLQYSKSKMIRVNT